MKIVLLIEEISGVPNWEVVDLCKEFGPCQVSIRDRNAWCYAEYDEGDDALYALKQLDGYAFGNKNLKVKIHRKIYDRKSCFYFERDGYCRFGDDCRYVHNEVPKIAEKSKTISKKTAKKPVEKKVSSLKKLAPAPKKDAAPKKLAGSNAELFPVLPEKEEFVPAPKKVFVPAPRKSAASSDEWTSICKKAPKAPKLTQEQIMRNELSENLPRLYQDLNIIKDACKTTLGGGDLDLMFIMDCTSSMSSWISACQQEIMKIVNKIKDENDCKIKISFVGYTDFDQKGEDLYSILDFTEDIDKFSDFVYKVRARGGGDAAEDMCGGFEKALVQSWSEKSTKVAVIVADCPCHGSEFHNDKYFSDDHKGGDPKGRCPKRQISRLAGMGIDIYGIKIAEYTDTMYKVFNTSYKPIAKKDIKVTRLGHSTKDFALFVSQSASLSLSVSKTANSISTLEDHKDQLVRLLANKTKLKNPEQLQKLLQNIKSFKNINAKDPTSKKAIDNAKTLLKEIEFLRQEQKADMMEESKTVAPKNMIEVDYSVSKDNTSSPLSGAKEVTARSQSFYIVQERDGTPINWKKPLIDSCQMTTKLKIAKTPFSEGSFRYAFEAHDSMLDQKMVLKLGKKIDLDEYNPNGLSQELEQISICNLITGQFNERIIDKVSHPDVLRDFIRPFIYEILDKRQLKYYFAENYIEGEYKKQNNNGGWTADSNSDESQIAQALSHFSWQLTRGYLIVVDIQGVGNVLTDPLIHSLDESRFDSGNFGYEGILKFFMSHKCNKYCRDLNLVHPDSTESVDPTYSFYDVKKEYPRPRNMNTCINKLCDLCKNPYSTTSGRFYNARVKKAPNWCPTCQQENRRTKHIGTCVVCKADIHQSMHWYKMMRHDPHERCYHCRVELRAELRKELEVSDNRSTSGSD